MGIKFDKDPLGVEQNNYLTKIVYVYIVYDLDAWPRNQSNNFKYENCLFGATDIIQKSNKEKWVCSAYGIALDGAGSLNFGNKYVGNVVIFDVDNSSSSHERLLVLMEAFVHQRKHLVLILVKQTQKFA